MEVKRHYVTLPDRFSKVVQTHVQSGRYKNFSAAIRDAVGQFFIGPPTVFEEYGVTPEEVERSAQRNLATIAADRKAGKLKPFKRTR